jgi:hypothetical protein
MASNGYVGECYVSETRDIAPVQEGVGSTLEVTVFKKEGDSKRGVARYDRNYHRFYNTFFPFISGGRPLALCSPDYTATSILDLETGKIIGGETPDNRGFCPVDLFVPFYRRGKRKIILNQREETKDIVLHNSDCLVESSPDTVLEPVQYHPFGFVAGCVWGDDRSWKIQYLDLSRAHEGILKRDRRLGYLALPGDSILEAIFMEGSAESPRLRVHHMVELLEGEDRTCGDEKEVGTDFSKELSPSWKPEERTIP